MVDEQNLTVRQGNQVRLRFELSVRGVGPWDVSGMASGFLEVEGEDGVALASIALSATEDGADWVHGVVTVLLPEAYTEAVQRLGYTLTLVMGDETVSPCAGGLVVERRQGYTPPP